MSSIHYFQRYSQKENVITNNTLLLFSRLYHHDPSIFSAFISSVVDDDRLQFGVIFSQQEKGESSTPDGIVVQKPVKIVIETKKDKKDFHKDQITAHFTSFKKDYQCVLFLVAPQKLDKKEISMLAGDNSNHAVSLTFEEIIAAARDSISEFEIEMTEIIDDYEDFCATSGLSDQSWRQMESVLVSKSLTLNIKYGMYFRPLARGYRSRKFLGLYSSKAIRAIGTISKTICPSIDLINKTVNLDGKLTEDEKCKLIAITEEALIDKGWDIAQDHRFFITDKFYQTEFKKISSRAPMGTKVFNLVDYVPSISLTTTSEAIAGALNNQTWA